MSRPAAVQREVFHHVRRNAARTRRHRLLGAGAPLFYDRPLHLVKGGGESGSGTARAGSISTPTTTCRTSAIAIPHVVEALADQAASAQPLHPLPGRADPRVCRGADRRPSRRGFHESRSACSGTEASELALRIARACTGNEGVIVTDFCYHGNSAVDRRALHGVRDRPRAGTPGSAPSKCRTAPTWTPDEAAADVERRHRLAGRGRHETRRDLLRHDLRDRRHAGGAGRLRRAGGGADARGRRALYRRRGAAGSRPHRAPACGGTSSTTRCRTS